MAVDVGGVEAHRIINESLGRKRREQTRSDTGVGWRENRSTQFGEKSCI